MNDLWYSYLTGLGYTGALPDMISKALIERVDRPSSINDMWYQFLYAEVGLSGTIDDLMRVYLESKGYTGSIPDMLRESLIAEDFFDDGPAPSCDITLVDDYAAAFGGLPATIAGQLVSASNAGTAGFPNYIATTDLANSPALWSSGTRIIEMQGITVSEAVPGEVVRVNLIMAASDGSQGVAATFDASQDAWAFSIQQPVGTVAATAVVVAGSPADVPAVGIDSDGNCYAYLTQSGVTSSQLFGPEADGFFVGSEVGIAATITLEESKQASFSVVTDRDSYFGAYPAEHYDWCGNALPEPFDPMVLFAGGIQGAWHDPSDLTTLFQDAAGTIPVTTDGDPVGLMLDKSKGLELGPEISTEYDSGDWYIVGGSPNQWQIDSANVASVDNTGGTISCYLRSDNLGMVEGKTYRIEFEILASNGVGGFRLTNGTDNTSPIFLSTGPVSIVFKAGGVNVGTFGPQAYGGWIGSISNISVKELPGNHASQTTTAAKPTYRTDGIRHWLEFDSVDDYLPWMPPKYTGMMSMAIAYRLNSGIHFQSWSSMVGVNGNVLGLSRVGDNSSIMAPLPWNDALVRVNGEEVDLGIYRRTNLYDDAVSGECIGVAEGVDWSLGNPGVGTTPRQTIRYAAQPTTGGRLYAYVEVEMESLLSYRDKLEQWLAEKAGVTLP